VLDDLGREAMTAVGEQSHLDILQDTPLFRPGFQDIAVPPYRNRRQLCPETHYESGRPLRAMNSGKASSALAPRTTSVV
jgi:hypothetical protein